MFPKSLRGKRIEEEKGETEEVWKEVEEKQKIDTREKGRTHLPTESGNKI